LDEVIKLLVPIAVAVIGAFGGYAMARVTARAGREQQLTAVADARLKLLMDSYEKRQQGLVEQLDASERRVETLTRQYEQRIENLLHKIDVYEKRLAARVDEIDPQETNYGDNHG
jgi:uncharacterized membrane-anchored protein YhcB (DUF1043 family)